MNPDGTEVRYLHFGDRVLEERDETDNTIATYVYGPYIDDVVSMQRGGVDYYYHADDQYNVLALTDSSGNIVETYEYSDYGEPFIFDAAGNPLDESSVGNPYLYTGRHYDYESELYYYRTRYMSPELGRFTTIDSIGIWGDLSNLGNGYTYVGNNPYRFVDPYGLEREEGDEPRRFQGEVERGAFWLFGQENVETFYYYDNNYIYPIVEKGGEYASYLWEYVLKPAFDYIPDPVSEQKKRELNEFIQRTGPVGNAAAVETASRHLFNGGYVEEEDSVHNQSAAGAGLITDTVNDELKGLGLFGATRFLPGGRRLPGGINPTRLVPSNDFYRYRKAFNDLPNSIQKEIPKMNLPGRRGFPFVPKDIDKPFQKVRHSRGYGHLDKFGNVWKWDKDHDTHWDVQLSPGQRYSFGSDYLRVSPWGFATFPNKP